MPYGTFTTPSMAEAELYRIRSLVAAQLDLIGWVSLGQV